MIISLILLMALVTVSYMLVGARRQLKDVLAQGSSSITAQRDVIAQKCKGPTANKTECQAAIAQLAQILRDFNADLSATASSTGARQ